MTYNTNTSNLVHLNAPGCTVNMQNPNTYGGLFATGGCINDDDQRMHLSLSPLQTSTHATMCAAVQHNWQQHTHMLQVTLLGLRQERSGIENNLKAYTLSCVHVRALRTIAHTCSIITIDIVTHSRHFDASSPHVTDIMHLVLCTIVWMCITRRLLKCMKHLVINECANTQAHYVMLLGRLQTHTCVHTFMSHDVPNIVYRIWHTSC